MMEEQVKGKISLQADLSGKLFGVPAVSNYESLEDKPQINSVELSGNKSAQELGFAAREEVEAMTELPPLPQREGMICQGWNWTLESIKNAKRDVDIGAIYITDDGATRIYISLVEGALNPILGFSQMRAGSVWIDWGDESPLETSAVMGKGNTVEMVHQYPMAGDYVIQLIPEEDAVIYVFGDANGTKLLRKIPTSSSENNVYSGAIQKIEFGRGIAGLEGSALTVNNLRFVTIPNEITNVKAICSYCYGLEYIALPRTLVKLPSSMFTRCDSMRVVSLPDTLTEISSSCFSDCYKLERITFPDTLEQMGSYAMNYCESLKRIVVPENTTVLNNAVFDHCAALKGLCCLTASRNWEAIFCITAPI